MNSVELSVDFIVEEIVSRVNKKRDLPVNNLEKEAIIDKVSSWSKRFSRESLALSESEFSAGWELESLDFIHKQDFAYDLKQDLTRSLWPKSPRMKIAKDLKRYFAKNRFGLDAVNIKRKEEIISFIKRDLYLNEDISLNILPAHKLKAIDKDSYMVVAIGPFKQKYKLHFNEEHCNFDEILMRDAYGELELLCTDKLVKSFSNYRNRIEAHKETILNFSIFDRFLSNHVTGDKEIILEPSLTDRGEFIVGLYSSSEGGYTLCKTDITATGRTQWETKSASSYHGRFVDNNMMLDVNDQYYFRDRPLIKFMNK